MNLGSIIVGLLKGKALVLIGTSAVLTGGAAVMAATPTGQHLIKTVITTQKTIPTPTSSKDDRENSSHQDIMNHKGVQDDSSHRNANANDHKNLCPGLAEAQRLAANFSLDTAAESDDMDAICTLHTGTFKGTTPNGQEVLSRHALGYGEINQLLTYAQDLASHDQANTDGKLTNGNVRAYLAAVLQRCGTTPLVKCVRERNHPSPQPDPTPKDFKGDIATLTSHVNGNKTDLNNHGSDNKTSLGNHSPDNRNTGGKPINTPIARP